MVRFCCQSFSLKNCSNEKHANRVSVRWIRSAKYSGRGKFTLLMCSNANGDDDGQIWTYCNHPIIHPLLTYLYYPHLSFHCSTFFYKSFFLFYNLITFIPLHVYTHLFRSCCFLFAIHPFDVICFTPLYYSLSFFRVPQWFLYFPFPLHHPSFHPSISPLFPTLSITTTHLSYVFTHPPLQLIGLWWCRRPRPGSAPDRDGRHWAAPRRHCAGRHQPARHDR